MGMARNRDRKLLMDMIRGHERTGFWRESGPVEAHPGEPQLRVRIVFRYDIDLLPCFNGRGIACLRLAAGE